jgi:hypothetical protein
MSSNQVKSKKRVADHGEVFTSEREVNAMLDLVKHEAERIDSRFLEPACGDGNFLVEILKRKLNVVKRKYKRSPMEYEKYSVLAVSSLYGVDLLLDNVLTCRERLYNTWNEEYTLICKKEINEECRKSIKFILERNIVCGNALSLKKVNDNGEDTFEPIVFSEWSLLTGLVIQRNDYTFDKLLAGYDKPKDIFQQGNNNSINHQISMLNVSNNDPGNESINHEGEFLKRYITQYRRLWEDGE